MAILIGKEEGKNIDLGNKQHIFSVLSMTSYQETCVLQGTRNLLHTTKSAVKGRL